MECEATLQGHTDGVRHLTLLPGGCLASASYDKTIKIWNPELKNNLNNNNNTNNFS